MATDQHDDFTIRAIAPGDNAIVADIIRSVMTELGAVGDGYSINDPEIGDMHEAYRNGRGAFYVVEAKGQVLGCAGFAHLKGGTPDTCELRKMYLLPGLRGRGAGSALLQRCLEDAAACGYARCYLETKDDMHAARRLYEKHGFAYLAEPMGDTGHTACGTWMAREIISVNKTAVQSLFSG